MNTCVSCGKRYAPIALATYAAKNVSDCVTKNTTMMLGVWKSMGRKGNTPPQTPAALMAKNKA